MNGILKSNLFRASPLYSKITCLDLPSSTRAVQKKPLDTSSGTGRSAPARQPRTGYSSSSSGIVRLNGIRTRSAERPRGRGISVSLRSGHSALQILPHKFCRLHQLLVIVHASASLAAVGGDACNHPRGFVCQLLDLKHIPQCRAKRPDNIFPGRNLPARPPLKVTYPAAQNALPRHSTAHHVPARPAAPRHRPSLAHRECRVPARPAQGGHCLSVRGMEIPSASCGCIYQGLCAAWPHPARSFQSSQT